MRRTILSFVAIYCFSGHLLGQVDSTWDGTTGFWSDASKWSSVDHPNNGNGGLDYNAIIAGGTVEQDLDITIAGLILSGQLMNPGNMLTVNGPTTWSTTSSLSDFDGNGTTIFNGPLDIVSTSGGLFRIRGGHVLNNAVAATWTEGNISVGQSSIFNNLAGATFETNFDGQFGLGQGGTFDFNNAGTFTKSAGTEKTDFNGAIFFNNTGTVNVDAGTLDLAGGGVSSGDFNIAPGATLELAGNHELNTGSSVNGDGNFTVTSGTTNLAGGALSPGTSIGTMNLSGEFNLVDNAVIEIEIDAITGTAGQNWDFLNGLTATLDFAEAGFAKGATIKLITIDDMGNPAELPDFDPIGVYSLEIATAQAFEDFDPLDITIDTSEFQNQFSGCFFPSIVDDNGQLSLVVSYSNGNRGDVNRDGDVNLLDVAPFVQLLSTGKYQEEADVNCDGQLNLFDVNVFVAILTD